MAATDKAPELGPVVVGLLKGVLYRDESPALWQGLLTLRPLVGDYVAVLGLELLVDENEGHAFLRSRSEDPEAGAPPLPRLIARRPLSYPVSLLLALLRKRLAEFDAGEGGERLVLSKDDIQEMVRVLLPPGTDEARWAAKLEAALNRIVELGFLRRLRGQDRIFEVRRIIAAFIDAQWLTAFDERLEEYRNLLGHSPEDTDG